MPIDSNFDRTLTWSYDRTRCNRFAVPHRDAPLKIGPSRLPSHQLIAHLEGLDRLCHTALQQKRHHLAERRIDAGRELRTSVPDRARQIAWRGCIEHIGRGWIHDIRHLTEG